jgi:hypothetical protein
MKLKCDRKLPLCFSVVKVVCSEEGINKKPKHVANYFKQQGTCLPVKLCRPSIKIFLFSYWKKTRDTTHQEYSRHLLRNA